MKIKKRESPNNLASIERRVTGEKREKECVRMKSFFEKEGKKDERRKEGGEKTERGEKEKEDKKEIEKNRGERKKEG